MPTLYRMPTCTCVEAWLPVLIRVLRLFGVQVTVTQLTGGYAKSGGTHTGGGAIDLIIKARGPRTLRRAYKLIERLARRYGADASWYRPENWDGKNGVAHVHITLTGCRHKSEAAQQQLTGPRGVRAGTKGRNGLANGAQDPGYRPLSGRTWRQGLAFMRARLKPSPDPAPAPAPAAPTTPRPVRRLALVQLINHGAATIALKRPGAWAKWLRRRARLVGLVRDAAPDVLGGLECGRGLAWKYLLVKYGSWRVVPVVGAGGRWLWRNAKRVPIVVAKDVFRPLARHAGRVMDSPWFIGQMADGALVLFGLAHLDHEASSKTRVACMTEILDNLEAVAREHGLGRSQIVIMADTADKSGAVRVMLARRGYADAFDVAKKTVNADLRSMTRYRKPVEETLSDPSVDGTFVWRGFTGPGVGDDHARPVELAEKGDDYIATDHLSITADISRQEAA